MAHLAQSPYFVLHQLTCQFADGETLFGPLDLAFDRSRCGLVGRNGVGKTQLLRLIAGLDLPGNGHVESHAAVAYVAQQPEIAPHTTLAQLLGYGEVFAALARLEQGRPLTDDIDRLEGRWDLHDRLQNAFAAAGLPAFDPLRSASSLSGGERMRASLCGALLGEADFLLLDEPTNHLDLDAVIWLERWLKSYPGTLVLISHDRDFLDPIVDKILHIEQQTMNEYTGNYSSFERQRATKLAQQQSLYQHQQEKVAHLQSYIDRFRAQATKAKQAQSRIKMLERMELIAPAHVDNPFTFSFRPPESLPNPLLRMEKVSAGYGDKVILKSIKLNLVPGSRIGLLGRNGAGKSTLIKLLAGTLEPLSGEIGLAKGIKLGYFAQHQLEFLRADESPLQHLSRIAPRVLEQQLRDYLGGFGFQGDKVSEMTERFSGGEKARLVLALIVWQRPNLLLLDEPTNDLDIETLRALENALLEFPGCAMVISHDRWFLDRIATHILDYQDEGKVEFFEGNFTEYEEYKKRTLGADALEPHRIKYKKIAK
ncbi:ATP-binding cassette domain-containing protein [Serratia marcescens]|nr:ATP-binding cassette domain-containing protein [Serratia marcescens]RTF94499.1 ATP-binding cassette domain-containing protein [Serratia marcescens]